MYPKEYVFPLPLTPEWRAEIQQSTQERLSEMLGVEVDNVMAEYVLVMVGNKKNMAQIAHDLIDFIGDESAEQFVEWLSTILPTYEAKASSSAASAPARASSSSTPATTATAETPAAAPKQRIISLKGNSNNDKKLVSLASSRSSSSSTVRTLSRAATDAPTAADVLAKRSQRFGIVEKSSPPPSASASTRPKKPVPTAAASSAPLAAKRKASSDLEHPPPRRTSSSNTSSGGRLSQLLGPPVNVDQAELDARASLQSNKRKKTNARGASDNARRTTSDASDAPPLPPGDEPIDEVTDPRTHNGTRGPHGGGYYNGPPGYGGFAPPPYGHPMYFQPPPYGQMPPPYGMGFAPHHHPHSGGRGHFGNAYHPHSGRAPRPNFQNRTWVNPNAAVKTDDNAAADGASTTTTATTDKPTSSDSDSAALNATAPAFAPRSNNPYYNANSSSTQQQQQQMRPRLFQNKTWVRPDAAKDEDFSLTLPVTPPPPSGVESNDNATTTATTE